jgi:hypothetical protein
MVKKVDSRGRSNVKKRGSNTKVQCQFCGKVVTKSGFVGHMTWKHGKDPKAPLLDKEKPITIPDARRKAADLDKFLDSLVAKLMKDRPVEDITKREAKYLVHLRDIGISSYLPSFVQDAMDRIMKDRGISFDEAKELLSEAIHNV